ncbi:MAG: S24 family peptidase, partial [Gammaproteobacteria bacterium]|nr:S24 family peptidase [Gammaproteobacteria bacterium]
MRVIMSTCSSSGCAENEPYALRVLGDSMQPEFNDGVVIVIDPAGAMRDGSYVIATHNEELIFRQLKIHEEKYFLQPLNDLYDTVEISGLEMVSGVVSQQAGRRRKDRKHYD